MPDSGSAPNVTFSRDVAGFTGSDAFEQLDAAGRKILSVDQDEVGNDIATALNARLRKDGSNFAADANLNGNKFTNVGNAAARTSFAAAGQVQDSSLQWAGTSSGTNTITASVTPAITAYAAGQVFRFIAGGTNTGAATLNLNSVGAIDIKKGPAGATALAAGDITAAGIYTVVYNGTTGDFELLNPKFPDGFATTDSPTFAAPRVTTMEVGHASDTTLARASAGNLSVEGNLLYRAGGTDVPITDGGTGASTAAAARIALAALGAVSVQTFTANGTWTKPSGCKYILVIGTGGGGGGGDGTTSNLGTGGGGAGGTCIELIDVSAISSETVTIGAGGSGGTSGGNGSNGGDTTFGAHFTASGGDGNSTAEGGDGGAASGGSLNIVGGDGIPLASANSGSGGASFWGGGGRGRTTSGSGNNAHAYGSGGGGGFSTGSTSGGDGAGGVVFVLEFVT